MRMTRSKTGHLPTPRLTIVDHEEEDVETCGQTSDTVDGTSSVGPISTASHVSRKRKRTPENSTILDTVQKYEALNAEVVEIQPVFQTFNTRKKLDNGLCILRSLGDDKYEIVNLNLVNPDAISSEETGLIIKNDDRRMKVMGISDSEWEMARYKCGQAIASAKSTIFRFLKLPIELRYKIYDFAIIGMKPLHRISRAYENPENKISDINLNLMCTSTQIYRETRPFFYRNNFRIGDVKSLSNERITDLRQNLREVCFEWWGFCNKDPASFRFFDSCKNLIIFNLVLTKFSVNVVYHRPQSKFQTDEALKPFSRTSGWDSLLSLRNLKRVTVKNHDGDIRGIGITEKDVKYLEEFLMKIVCQPKPDQAVCIPAPRILSDKNSKPKSLKTLKRKNNDEGDGEYHPNATRKRRDIL